MKISELMKELQDAKDKYGDKNITIEDCLDGDFDAEPFFLGDIGLIKTELHNDKIGIIIVVNN